MQPEGAMDHDPKQERREAHVLLDLLPPEKLNTVRALLKVMVEPLSGSLSTAATENEDLTPETAAAIARARTSLARGEGVSHEEVRREFGLSK